MEFANYQLDWPRENLSVRCFVHDVFNYRYHWHEDEYELNILLHGRQECCRGSENFHLDVDDVILVPPGVGHASMGSQVDTIAFVLHFSASAFKPLLKKGGIINLCIYSGGDTGYEEKKAILNYLKTLDSKKWLVIVNSYFNRKNDPPLPVFIYRLK